MLPLTIQIRKANESTKLYDVEDKEGVKKVLNLASVAIDGFGSFYGSFLGFDIECNTGQSLEDGRTSLLELCIVGDQSIPNTTRLIY